MLGGILGEMSGVFSGAACGWPWWEVRSISGDSAFEAFFWSSPNSAERFWQQHWEHFPQERGSATGTVAGSAIRPNHCRKLCRGSPRPLCKVHHGLSEFTLPPTLQPIRILSGMPTKLGRDVARILSESQILRDYERAFAQIADVPVRFHPAADWKLGNAGHPKGNAFCALVAENLPECAMCVEAQEAISGPTRTEPTTTVCMAGLYESAVPVKLGEEVLGHLKIGQVAQENRTPSQFKAVARHLIRWGLETDLKKLEEAYLHTRVIGKDAYQSMLRLLEVFAQHLALVARQIPTDAPPSQDPPLVQRAKDYIRTHQDEPLELAAVARAVNASVHHFCKVFKKATGVTFTEYLALVRVARAAELLADPHVRVSEVAYRVGFSSLTHFNRIFKKIQGQSPTAYRRKRLPPTAASA